MTDKEFTYSTKDLESNKAQLLDGFQMLNNQQEVSNYFENDSLSNFFKYVYEFTQDNYGAGSVSEIADFFLSNQFHLQLIRLDEYFSQICDRLVAADATVPQDVRKSSVFIKQQSISNFLLAYSVNFSHQYFQSGGLKYILNTLTNEVFYNNFKNTDDYKRMLVNLTCLPTFSYKSVWAELNAVDILLKIATKDKTYKRSVYDVVLKIANDTQINTISNMPEIVSIFIRSLKTAAEVIDKNDELIYRQKIEYSVEMEDGVYESRLFDVYCVSDEYDEFVKFPVTAALNTLYLLSVNDKIKFDLYISYNLKDPLRIIILKGTEMEKKFALELLAQLCFDNLVLEAVSRDTELVKSIELFSQNSLKDIIKFAKQILFSINHKNTNKQVDKSLNKISQVMISYNAGTRDLCIKIKGELEKAGFKVWIDIDEIHGSSLDSMTNAVETSEVVLMCVTENYRQSVNCQAEAQYAFKLKKPIIPLIMQKGYDSVGGWLGMIMGDKIFINFTKYVFEDAINRLKSQLVLLTTNTNNPVSVDSVKTEAVVQASISPASQNPIKWSEDEVVKWFEKDGVMEIYEYIKPCNGELLHQLYKMKVEAPEFFYHFVTEGARSAQKQIGGRNMLVFTKNLEELFKR